MIGAIERPSAHGAAAAILGIPAIDQSLPEGLARGGLHEIRGAKADSAARGFALVILGKLSGGQGHVLWCRMRYDALGIPYGPGLQRYGLSPHQITFVEVQNRTDALWAIEEGLKAGALSAVLGEGVEIDLTTSRRLQLAAETSGVTAIIQGTTSKKSSVAMTRWRLSSMPSSPLNPLGSRWKVVLERCRNGAVGEWILDWDEPSLAFRLVAAPGDGPSAEILPS